MKKYIIPIIGLVFMVLLVAGCTINSKTDQSVAPNVKGRTDNSGFKLISAAGELISQLRDDVASVDLQDADLDNIGEFDAATGTIGVLTVSATATTTDVDVSGTLTTGPIYTTLNPGIMQVFNIQSDGSDAAGTVHQATFQVNSTTVFALAGRSQGDNTVGSSTLHFIGTIKEKARVVSATSTFELGDNILNTDTSGASFTVTLDDDWISSGSPTEVATAKICDYLGNAGTNAVTIEPESGTINGGANVQLTANYTCVVLQADGTNVRNLAQ